MEAEGLEVRWMTDLSIRVIRGETRREAEREERRSIERRVGR